MGYPNFGKVKTIVLPIPSSEGAGVTYREYLEKYGIDLKDFIELDSSGYVNFKVKKNTIIYFDISEMKKAFNASFPDLLPLSFEATKTQYVQGSSVGSLDIFVPNYDSANDVWTSHYFIKFSILSTDEFVIENLKIGCSEY